MTVVRTPLVVGNWKMNGAFEANRVLIEALLAALVQKSLPDVGVCPPYPYIPQIGALLADSPIAWGAQSVSEHRTGAYTGQVSAAMLRDLGCTYVIVEHELDLSARHAHARRAVLGDVDLVFAAEVDRAPRRRVDLEDARGRRDPRVDAAALEEEAVALAAAVLGDEPRARRDGELPHRADLDAHVRGGVVHERFARAHVRAPGETVDAPLRRPRGERQPRDERRRRRARRGEREPRARRARLRRPTRRP